MGVFQGGMMRSLIVFIIGIFWASTTVFAQMTEATVSKSGTTPSTVANPNDQDDGEDQPPSPPPVVEAKKILVTGSYIRQTVSQTAPTPLSVYDQSRMLETGSFTVADALQESPVFNNVSSGAFLSMHGQSDADNLVLFNGLRLPKTAGGASVNIDFLPATMIERTEVLKDGASALYGSEALSGVVNIISKRDQDGANFIARYTSPQDQIDQETTVGMSYGKNWGKTHFLGALQFKKDDPVRYKDTEYGTKDVRLGGSLYSNLANLQSGNTFYRDPNCPQDRLDARGRCRYDSRAQTILGTGEDRQYYSAYMGLAHEVSDSVKFDALAIYTRRNWTYNSSPATIELRDETAIGGENLSIPAGVANGWGAVNSATGNPAVIGANPNFLYAAWEELGERLYERKVDNYINQARAYGEVSGWDWEVSAGHGLTFFNDTLLNGNASKRGVYDILVNQGYNPLSTPGTKNGAFASAALQTWYEHSSDIINSKAYAAGPLFQMGAEPLNMAIGVEGQWMSFKQENDPWSLEGIPLTGKTANQRGQREVYSTFVEFTHSPTKHWELQAAARFDEYSDVGNTVNPKLGASYHASEKVTFRASYGTGFKAPDLLAVNQGEASAITQGIRDPKICEVDPNDSDCANTVANVTSFGNKNLKPETASHYNVGTVLTPNKDLTFVVDYWRVDGEQGLTAPDANTILRADSLGVDLSSFGIIVVRDPLQGDKVTSITYPARVNAGVFKIRGIDFGIQKRAQVNAFGMRGLNVRFTMEHSHVLSAGSTQFSFDPFTKQYNLNWKNFASIGVQKDKNFTKVIARTYAGGDKNTTFNTGRGLGSTNTLTEYDLHYERFLGEDSSVSMGIKNIFDKKPVNDASTPGVNFAAFSQANYLGRTFYVGYSHDF